MREWDANLARAGGFLSGRFGEAETAALIEEARSEFEILIPRLPEVGPSPIFRKFVTAAGWYLALWRVLQRQGRTVEDAGRLIWEVTTRYLDTVPGLLRVVFRGLAFSRRRIARVKQEAAKSRARPYPEGYVFDFVEGDGFLYGIDYRECATLKFLRAEGAAELAPYLCPLDIACSTALGWGLKRTTTLAEGFDRCDFRFRPGARTEVAVPAAIADRVVARLETKKK